MSTPRSWFNFKNSTSDPTVADIHIIDWIGDWVDDAINRYYGESIGLTARAFVEQLAALPENVLTLNVHINSPGGDVQGGVNIANALRQWGQKSGRTVNTYVDGLAASIASVIAMAGSRVVMSDNALMFLHDPWSYQIGNSRDMRKMADDLDAIRDGQIVSSYRWHSTLEAADIVALMQAETWLTADAAIEKGFATEKTEGLKAAASINPLAVAKMKIPDQYRDRVNAWLAPKEEPAPAPTPAAALDIVTICNENGCPELAAELIQNGAPLEQVRARATAVKTSRDQAAARASTITSMCAAAGLPKFADAYINGGMSVDGVRAQIALVKAALADVGIDTSIDPNRGASEDVQAGWKKAYQRINPKRR